MEGLAVGRLVRFTGDSGERAAVVTKVYGNPEGMVNLVRFGAEFDESAAEVKTSVPYDEGGRIYSWRWRWTPET